jgi:hypothetical protein
MAMSPGVNQTTIDAMWAEYAQIGTLITQVLGSAQPSYTENGRSVSKTEYLNALYEQRRKLLADIQQASGPFEVLA